MKGSDMASPNMKKIQEKKDALNAPIYWAWVSTTVSKGADGKWIQSKGQTYVKSEHGKL